MLGAVPAGGCPAGYILNAAGNDCDADTYSPAFETGGSAGVTYSTRGGTEVVVVKAKPVKAKVSWGWGDFWKGITIPAPSMPAPRNTASDYFPLPAPARPFYKTAAGIALIAVAAIVVVALSTKKKKSA